MGQMYQGNFRRIAFQTEHRFTKEHPADGDSIEPADQPVIFPDLRRVGESQLVKLDICLFHFLGNPGLLPAGLRHGTGVDHLAKCSIKGELVVAVA